MFSELSKESLQNLLRRYKASEEESPIVLYESNWTIAEGGYDKWWEIYYGKDSRPVAECIAGNVSVYGFSDADNEVIKNIILSVLTYLK